MVVFALHARALRKGLYFDHSEESGAGASLMYVYKWQLGGHSGCQHCLVLHCDPFGKIDDLEVPTKQQTQAFAGLTSRTSIRIKLKGVSMAFDLFNGPEQGETKIKQIGGKFQIG